MTEPDEALIWARERAAAECDEDGFPIFAEEHRAGKHDHFLTREAHAYRAGQAASAERIKALEYDLMWTDQAWEAAQEAVVYGYTLMDKQDARIKALEEEIAVWNSVFPDLLPDRLKSDKEMAEEDASAKIDAARIEGIRLGLEAAAEEADAGRRPSMDWCDHIAKDIRALDPATIAKGADQ